MYQITEYDAKTSFYNISKTVILNINDGKKYIFFNVILKHIMTLINTVLK